MKTSSHHCPSEESPGGGGGKNTSEVKKQRSLGGVECRWQSKWGSQKKPYDYNSPCENCSCDL